MSGEYGVPSVIVDAAEFWEVLSTLLDRVSLWDPVIVDALECWEVWSMLLDWADLWDPVIRRLRWLRIEFVGEDDR